MLALKNNMTITISPDQIPKYLNAGFTICDDHALALNDPMSYVPDSTQPDENVQTIANLNTLILGGTPK